MHDDSTKEVKETESVGVKTKQLRMLVVFKETQSFADGIPEGDSAQRL